MVIPPLRKSSGLPKPDFIYTVFTPFLQIGDFLAFTKKEFALFNTGKKGYVVVVFLRSLFKPVY
jgi:hypothetical protein